MSSKRQSRISGNSIWPFIFAINGTSVAIGTNGVALVYSISVLHKAIRCNRWLNKYIFPASYTPSLEQMTRAAGRQGLKILDINVMRGNYAETVKQWWQAFRQNIATVRQDYQERFIRMWEFYLVGC